MNANLNMKEGGEVAVNFRRLYNYLYRRLGQANRAKEKTPLEESLSHLRVLRDSWAKMLRNGGEPRAAADLAPETAAA
jgi:flagellar protein FliS